MKGTLFGCICLMVAASIWGGMYVVSKHVMTYISPFVLLWLRFLVAFLFLMPIFMRSRERVDPKDIPYMAWLGFIGYFVANGSGFIGTHLSTAHMGSLITSAAPAFTVLFAYWILGESLSAQKVIAVITATAGVLIVIGMESEDSDTLGNMFLLLDALSWGLYCVYVKKAAANYSALTVTIYATGAALLITTPVMIWDFTSQDYIHLQSFSIWLGILYLGIIATALGFFLWNKGMEAMEAGIGSVFYFFTPLVGSALGWLILDEHLTWNFFVGGILILIGSGIVILKGKVKKNKEHHSGWAKEWLKAKREIT